MVCSAGEVLSESRSGRYTVNQRILGKHLGVEQILRPPA
jgi:hypothetical protein